MTLLLPERLRGPFWRAVVRPQFLIVFAILLLAGDLAGRNFLFEPPATWFGDFLLRQRDRVQARVTRLVRVDEDDQKKILGGQLPVNGLALANAVCALVKSGPMVVVVDIDTGSEHSFPADFRLPTMGAPVVWAVDADWKRGKKGLELEAEQVRPWLPQRPLWGIARMPVGFDGLVRGWDRSCAVNGQEELSLAAAAVKQYCSAILNECHEAHETAFGREYLFTKLNLADFDSADFEKDRLGTTVPKACPVAEASARDPLLEGHIVVLGAMHSRADKHDTPWGTKYGAELVASAIEEDLNPDGLAHMPVAWKWVTKAFIALGIAALHHYLRPVWATAFSVLALRLAVLLSGFMAFYFGEYELAVVPLVVGIVLEQLFTSVEKAQHWANAQAG
jgi:hypothetical protein